ncbi:MAG: hypothetical protein JW840_02975 [Candidatus Thermoplasmatota archaeon]|nr:hypothetical protein [Candidatus Thermoplasmatota archaeon]
MKVILSRKGFDSTHGGYPSPILHNRKMISLPIPDYQICYYSYSDLQLDEERTYFDLMHELKPTISLNGKKKHLTINTRCHPDPDIYPWLPVRPEGWKPALGQFKQSQSHLHNQHVDISDLFLFFGRFCTTQFVNEHYEFFPSIHQDFHALFGYLQIGEILSNEEFPAWLRNHPHAIDEYLLSNENNRIYVASESLSWENRIPGAGTFFFNENLKLTRNGTNNICEWNLPYDLFGNVSISYHPNPWRDGYFQSANIGQEFVIQDNVAVEDWAKTKIQVGLGDNLYQRWY